MTPDERAQLLQSIGENSDALFELIGEIEPQETTLEVEVDQAALLGTLSTAVLTLNSAVTRLLAESMETHD